MGVSTEKNQTQRLIHPKLCGTMLKSKIRWGKDDVRQNLNGIITYPP